MKILVKQYSCPICFKKMNNPNDNGVLDKKVFLCISNNSKYGKKISLRINSVFGNIKAPSFILYFVIFECFFINKSINKTLIEIKELCRQLNKNRKRKIP